MFIILLLTRIYIGGIALVLLNAVSTIIFTKSINGRRLKALGESLALVAFWPIAVFSVKGRKKLFLTTNKF